jgi:hypothetical protein
MFDKEEPSGWPEDTMHFAKRATGIRNAAQGPCGHHCVNAGAFEADCFG